MENPYWHDEFKPHLIDRVEIRLLCFEIDSIVAGSMSRQGSGMDLEQDESPEFSILDQLCFRMAESELSKRLLRLALLVRTFDDTMSRSEDPSPYDMHRKRIEEDHSDFGAVHQGPENTTKTLRECSNKIVHAEDLRPVYDTEDDRADPNAMWGMDGTLELYGKRSCEPWHITIYLRSYLEGVLELIQFGESERQTAAEPE
jgi:hypothetical protein